MQLKTQSLRLDLEFVASLLSTSLGKIILIAKKSFRNGNQMEYTGGRTENEIVNWILKKVGPPSTTVDCDGLKAKVESSKLVLAYFGEESDAEFKSFFVDLSG